MIEISKGCIWGGEKGNLPCFWGSTALYILLCPSSEFLCCVDYLWEYLWLHFLQVTSSSFDWLDPSFQLNVPLVDVDKVCLWLCLNKLFYLNARCIWSEWVRMAAGFNVWSGDNLRSLWLFWFRKHLLIPYNEWWFLYLPIMYMGVNPPPPAGCLIYITLLVTYPHTHKKKVLISPLASSVETWTSVTKID